MVLSNLFQSENGDSCPIHSLVLVRAESCSNLHNERHAELIVASSLVLYHLVLGAGGSLGFHYTNRCNYLCHVPNNKSLSYYNPKPCSKYRSTTNKVPIVSSFNSNG